MKQLPVVYLESARQDFRDIFDRVEGAAQNTDTAFAFISRIYDACERIGDVPHSGRSRGDLLPGLRTMPFERRAVIAYRVVDDMVEILNVFYAGRDYDAFYASEAAERGEPPDEL